MKSNKRLNSIEKKLAELKLELPPLPKKLGSYVLFARYDRLLWVSGQGPIAGDEVLVRGKVGRDLSVEEAKKAAEMAALSCLSVVKKACSTLDIVERVIKLVGYVNAVEGFCAHPKVINGASDLFIRLWGERGKHARSAIGVASLPLDIPVEIEVVFLLKEALEIEE